MKEEDRSILRLEKRLKKIESKLKEVSEQLEKSSKRSKMFFGVGMGFAGIGAALALALTSPEWGSVELRPSELSFLLMGMSLAIIHWSLLGFEGDYRKTIGIIGTLLMIMGPVALIISGIWFNIPWVNLGSILAFVVGWGMLVLSSKGGKQRE